MKNNIDINITEIPAKYSTGKNNSYNISDIPLDEENNTNHIENNDIEMKQKSIIEL